MVFLHSHVSFYLLSSCPELQRPGNGGSNFINTQAADIPIEDTDYILDSDDREGIEAILRNNRITTVIFVGAHLNQCVIIRPIGARMLQRLPLNLVFIPDLLDVMYNPATFPYLDTSEEGVQVFSRLLEKFYMPSSQIVEEE